ncbi:MAG: hypothetical protein KF785_06325 [Gemmatimonadales bacterium]|nr:hypothetical protein [Gemmatimonadales bacterium]
MNEQELERLLRESGDHYRIPPEPRLDAIWRRVEHATFDAPAPTVTPRRTWLGPLALAATLVIGVGLGFGAAKLGLDSRDADPVETVAVGAPAPNPFVGVAGDYLQQTSALLAAVTHDPSGDAFIPGAIGRARELLSTTRLVLDAGVTDPALRDLLEDLELVLVQIVRLPQNRPAADAQLINETLDQRDVMPRLSLFLTNASLAP